ncbi:MAG: winged helix-turn-helix domain-containing protein [Promethearchaeota archaeon]
MDIKKNMEMKSKSNSESHLSKGKEDNNLNFTEDQFYIALGHDIRRKILKIIGDNGFSSFSAFKKQIQSSTGTIYHHLEVMKDLIIQDQKKKYHLTHLGEHAYRILNNNIQSIEIVSKQDEKVDFFKKNRFSEVFLLKKLSEFMTSHIKESFLISFGILLVIGILSGINNLQIFLFFIQGIKISEKSSYYFFINFITVFISYFILLCTTEILSYFIFNNHDKWEKFLTLLSIPYFPIVVYLGIFSILNLIFPNLDQLFYDIMLLLFQVWSMILLAKVISLVKLVKFERGLLLAILIDYGTFMIMLILNNPFR